MNKQDFIKVWAAKNNLTYKAGEQLLDSFIETIKEGLIEDGRIQLVGFGAFELRRKKGKEGVSALTGKSYVTKESNVPNFKFATGFKKGFNE